MKKRLGFVGIILENRDESAEKVNHILHQHASMFVGRMGVPYKERALSVITLIVDATTDEIGALTGQLGALEGVSVKSALARPE
ncbi:MAG: iron-only hydrogenase system regulator [Candidatus Omnitrophica bacterium]|nr:iron-only hydrogenase system regulator [Candidatus Omnitrophota bacterium]